MSAVAAIVQPQGAVLLSDGITFNHPAGTVKDELKRSECQIHSTDTPKIFKINNSVGVTWVGNMIPAIQDNLIEECKGLSQPKEIAECLSEMLKDVHRGVDIPSLEGTPDNVNIAVTGYDRLGQAWGYNITCKRSFEPLGHRLATNGPDIMFIAPFVKGSNRFNRLLQKYNQQSTNPREVSTKAFTEMIRDYEAQDMIVGGEIFCEVLYPPKLSPFRQALQN